MMLVWTLFITFSSNAQNWVQTSAPNMNWKAVVSSANGTQLVAANANGSIWISTNSGTDWAQSAAPSYDWTGLASSANGSKLVAVTLTTHPDSYDGLVYISTNSGLTWATTTAPPTAWECVCSSTDGSRLAAGAEGPSIYLSTNSGASWTLANVGGFIYWPSIACSSDGIKIIATDGHVCISDDFFSTLTDVTTDNQAWISASSSSDGNKLIAVAPPSPIFGGLASGGVCISTDSGTNWIFNYDFAPSSVASSADGIIVVASVNGGQIYFSTNSGTTWTNSGLITSWSSVASSADGTKLVAVANGGGIWTAQCSPHPSINITLTKASIQLSWLLPSMDFLLQSSFDLINWSNVTNTTVLNLTNLQNCITFQKPNNNCFYRLKSP